MMEFADTFTEIGRRLTAGFSTLFDRLPAILGDPRAYPRDAMLLAAIAALFLLVLVLIVYLVVDFAQNARTTKSLGVERRTRRFPVVPIVLVLLAALGLGTALLIPSVAQTSTVCGSCHATMEPVASWERGSHASVACYGCHARPGLLGVVEASVRGAGARLTGQESSASVSPVTFAGGCVDCHEDVLSGVTDGAVRVRHSDIIEAGWSCLDCHVTAGHEDLDRAQPSIARSIMSDCLICHDGQTASAECDTCHVSGPLDTTLVIDAPSAGAPYTCEGCHSAETDQRCVDCHGLVLPHPESFFSRHAGLSWNEPELCQRCHEEAKADEGCGCHSEVNVHGTYTQWFPRHGPEAYAVYPGGCNCHSDAFCATCHTTSPF